MSANNPNPQSPLSPDIPEGLHCPITLELLDDPVSTPCCGNAFSRVSLQAHLQLSDGCPLCRVDLVQTHPEFDVNTAPRNRTIAGLVDAFRKAKISTSAGSGKRSQGSLAVAAICTTIPYPMFCCHFWCMLQVLLTDTDKVLLVLFGFQTFLRKTSSWQRKHCSRTNRTIQR